jgi:hypothetical protein
MCPLAIDKRNSADKPGGRPMITNSVGLASLLEAVAMFRVVAPYLLIHRRVKTVFYNVLRRV